MSRRTDALCHSGGQTSDTSGSPHNRGSGKGKNVKHLEEGSNTKEHLKSRLFYSRALRVQNRPATHEDGERAPSGAQTKPGEPRPEAGPGGAAKRRHLVDDASSSRVTQVKDFNCFQTACSYIVYRLCSYFF